MVASATSLVFDDLKKGFNKNEVLARVVHFWGSVTSTRVVCFMGLNYFLLTKSS
uniref:Uncharacterized protein n=1 Tax=Brassica oleracea TaxID=3712 RepID=A0A3P6FCG7_BRAOL|nr:unnamed protein product [Brassica oleracea]